MHKSGYAGAAVGISTRLTPTEQAQSATMDALPSWRWEFKVGAGAELGGGDLVPEPVPIRRWEGAFQAIGVPPGSHAMAVEYRLASVAVSAAINAVSSLTFAGWLCATCRYHSKRSDI